MSRPDLQLLPRRRPTSSAWLHGAMAVMLLLAQALGLLHRTAHGPTLTEARHASAAPAADEHAAPSHAAASPFGHAAGEGDACRLFDQLALADLLTAATPTLPVLDAPCRAIDATGTADALAVSTAYQARAPPATG